MSFKSLANALAYVVTGVVVYAVALLLVGRALPGDLWLQAVREGKLGAAIILAAVALALGWIVAAAVH
ncbi:MAG TPA: DUF350 domain-containing protein [Bryobacteraceae bacterium]|jgi:uncharacterized membrane protein YjfL (UPF0719 family)|nr:DUF350 domain-containing protein [Bryobacteraceae bacterium]